MGDFTLVGVKAQAAPTLQKPTPWYQTWPMVSVVILLIIVLGCLLSPVFLSKDPGYMDLANCSAAPSREFWFGTDTMGRGIFSMIWSGGRLSLFIGVFATLLSTLIAIVFGSLSGCAGETLDAFLMRANEIFISIPNLLLIVLLQAIWGQASALSLAVVIGLTSWMSISKVVRAEVRVLRESEYVQASKCMGGGFLHILRVHLAPNFLPSILFMVIMNVRSAILAESTLSFLGLGLPLEIVSWGSMLSLSEKALLSGSWWIIVIPGLFLIVTLLCLTEIGSTIRRKLGLGQSVL